MNSSWTRKSVAVAALCGVLFFIAILSLYSEAPITDEIEHIGSGYFFSITGLYPFNLSQPPLIKAIAALPLHFLHLNDALFLERNPNVPVGVIYGFSLFYTTGNDPLIITLFARLSVLLFNCILLIIMLTQVKAFFGRSVAWISFLLLASSPTFFAHARYVTMDVPVALALTIAILVGVKYMLRGGNTALITAVLCGLVALHIKFSAFILFPTLFLGATFYRFSPGSERSNQKRNAPLIRAIGLITCVTSLLIATYLPIATRKSSPPPNAQVEHSSQPAAIIRAPVPQPGVNLLQHGVKYQLRRLFEVRTERAYFAGDIYTGGNKLFFPTLFILKEQIVWLLLVFSGIIFSIWSGIKRHNQPNSQYFLATLSLSILTTLYGMAAIFSQLNIGLRHLLPIYPALTILAAIGCTMFMRRSVRARHIVYAGLVVSYSGFLLSFPHYLSHYNLFGGGKDGYVWGIDSNFDWGQDTQRLVKWMNDKRIDHAHMDYFGRGNPFHFLPGRFVQWAGPLGKPPPESWFIISATRLQQARGRRGQAPYGENYEWLEEILPTERIGRSFFIYRITD